MYNLYEKDMKFRIFGQESDRFVLLNIYQRFCELDMVIYVIDYNYILFDISYGCFFLNLIRLFVEENEFYGRLIFNRKKKYL